MSEDHRIIAERQATHGQFRDSARVTQRLSEVINDELRRCGTDPGEHQAVIETALTAIAFKIGRVIAGDPTHLDHWDDLSGYPQLVAEEIRRATK